MSTFAERLSKVQSAVGCALPNGYVELLERGSPQFDNPVVVPFRDDVWDVVDFYQLGVGDKDIQLDEICRLVADVLPRFAIPIASDHSGNFFCLIAAGPQLGQVVWWDHERELDEHHTELVSLSLTDFLSSIRNSPDDED